MRRLGEQFTITLVLGIALMLAMPAPSAAEKVKKIDNFIVFLDQSGSMADTYPPLNKRKINLAIDHISRLDQAIPELNYNGGFALFSPYQLGYAPTPYKKGVLSAAASKVDTKFETFGRPTPMGYGLMDISPVIGPLSGKTALIMFTDGDSNAGIAPLPQAQALYSKYPNLCIHVVSFADTPNGKKIIDDIRALNGCSVATDASALATDAGMAKFVQDVFYAEGTPAPAPAPAMVPAAPKPMPMDSDGDGVTDDKDKCPNTPKGEYVDADGCTLKLTLHINFDFDKADIKPEFKADLEQAAQFSRKNTNVPYINIAGHTDSIGEDAYNQDLSLRRAAAVRNALINDYGIPASKLVANGYGEKQPIADNNTEDGRYQNRRVELVCCVVLPQ
jgi:OOP family OmpA-OmpF porin